MLGYGRLEYSDHYLHFKKKNDVEEYLKYEIKPNGNRFYAKDYVDFRKNNVQESNALMGMTYLTIMTPTYYDFEVDDIVLSVKDGKQWRINSVTVSDDNTMKQYSARPRKVTILELVR